MAASTASAEPVSDKSDKSDKKDDMETLREDLDALRADLSKLSKHLGGTVRAKAKAASDQAWSAKSSAEEAAKEQIDRIEKEVEAHPWRALGIAVAVGFVLGRIVK